MRTQKKNIEGFQVMSPFIFFLRGTHGILPQQFSSRKPLSACTCSALGR